MIDPDVPQMHDINAQLECALIESFLVERGHDPQVLRSSDDPQARAILAEAAKHATGLLTDHECRAHLVREIHGTK